jgi:hypothetical protein
MLREMLFAQRGIAQEARVKPGVEDHEAFPRFQEVGADWHTHDEAVPAPADGDAARDDLVAAEQYGELFDRRHRRIPLSSCIICAQVGLALKQAEGR